jgi:protein TonB
MKGYFICSAFAHGVILAGLLVVGTLLSKPRMSYYAVDLFNSLPAGGSSAVSTPSVAPVTSHAPKAVKVPKVAAPKPSAEEELPAQDTIRLLAKLKKKRLALRGGEPKPAPVESPTESANPGRGGVGLPGNGPGIVAEAGQAFPYPWYLKGIADRLDKQWHPPQEFAPNTVCQVTFDIDRSGQISGSKISKSSGDSLFDQLALRAVLYANPLAPLPNGFPDDTLKVHMKFVGRRL